MKGSFSVKRVIMSRNDIEEGILRISQLKTYLITRNFPLKIWLSEDQTRITGRIQYDAKSNKIVGLNLPFNHNGLPISDAFYATSVTKIKNATERGRPSNNVNVLMVQPLAENSPAFCVCAFGSDNCFTYKNVLDKWNTVIQLLLSMAFQFKVYLQMVIHDY